MGEEFPPGLPLGGRWLTLLAGVDALGFANYTGEVRYGLVDKARYAERTEVETFESLGAVQVERSVQRLP